LFQIKNLTKVFGGVTVLNSVSLDVNAGEVIAIIGASGSGKSTLLRAMNHLEIPTSGEVIFDGEALGIGNINKKRQQIGFVFQNFNLFPNMNVLKNVTIAKRLNNRRIPKAAIEEKAIALLCRFGLGDKVKASPSSLSGGQKQRVAIVRALMTDPKIMLFDEPTSALDPEMVKEVLDVIRELAQSGMTMVIVTHEMKFAKNIASKIIYVDEGKIAESGTPDQIFNNPQCDRLKEFLSKILD